MPPEHEGRATPAAPAPTEPTPRTTAEHAARRAESATRATAEYAVTSEHTATRATPLGAVSIRGPKPPGLRLHAVASLDHHSGVTTLATGTQLVTFRDVGAVVAPSPYAVEPLGAHDLERHCAIVDEVFARHAVVPAPPGTVFRSRDRLAGWLELHYYTLAEALDFVTDRVVARVTVRRGDAHAAEAAAVGVPPVALRPVTGASAGIVASDLVALAADALRELRRDAIALIVVRAGAEAGAAEETHASFLVERTRWEAFADAVGAQSRRHGALRLDCTGPWPPYDFVRMQLTA